MPIQLPPVHLPDIELPPEPADPPNLMDIHRAWMFCRRVDNRFQLAGVNATADYMASPEDFANAQLYLHKVVHAAAVGGQVDAADVQPLILQAVQQLNGINQLLNQHINDSNQQFNQINHRLNNIDQQFNNINQQFNGINQHFEGVNQQFEGVNQQFEGVNQHLHVIDERLNRIEGRLVDMNEVLCQVSTIQSTPPHQLLQFSSVI
ncbi:hypothetical protein EDD17DRAFT_360379 [Pisolithus thermaeus]|nr:hypothetical protein EDD17DRAFT_360379 [Pisolithus thermaeus]